MQRVVSCSASGCYHFLFRLAIKTGELPIVEMLVKACANVNTVEKFQNQTPLMWAAAAPKMRARVYKSHAVGNFTVGGWPGLMDVRAAVNSNFDQDTNC